MTDVEELGHILNEIRTYSDLNETEKEALDGLGEHYGRLHDSAKSRDVLSGVAWDNIADSSHNFVGQVNSNLSIRPVIDPSEIPDENYRGMVEDIDNHVQEINEHLNQIEELANELDEHSE